MAAPQKEALAEKKCIVHEAVHTVANGPACDRTTERHQYMNMLTLPIPTHTAAVVSSTANSKLTGRTWISLLLCKAQLHQVQNSQTPICERDSGSQDVSTVDHHASMAKGHPPCPERGAGPP